MSRSIELRVVEARSRISNLSQVYVRDGDPLQLLCSIEAAQPTDFVYWYKNEVPILFDNLKRRRLSAAAQEEQSRARGQLVTRIRRNQDRAASAESGSLEDQEQGQERGVKQETDQDESWSPVLSSSSFAISQARTNDTGNYTCLVSLVAIIAQPTD